MAAVAKPGYCLWLDFADGVTDEVDLADLVGRGVFDRWRTPGELEKVQLDTQ